jgi:hypothetical protein
LSIPGHPHTPLTATLSHGTKNWKLGIDLNRGLTTGESRIGAIAIEVVAGVITVAMVPSVHVIYYVTHRYTH